VFTADESGASAAEEIFVRRLLSLDTEPVVVFLETMWSEPFKYKVRSAPLIFAFFFCGQASPENFSEKATMLWQLCTRTNITMFTSTVLFNGCFLVGSWPSHFSRNVSLSLSTMSLSHAM
jgi:hypothetical protein